MKTWQISDVRETGDGGDRARIPEIITGFLRDMADSKVEYDWSTLHIEVSKPRRINRRTDATACLIRVGAITIEGAAAGWHWGPRWNPRRKAVSL